MTDDAAPAEETVQTAAASAPEHEEYLSSGDRFVRWNLVSMLLALAALAAGGLFLKYAA